VLLNPAVLVVSGLSDVLGAIGRILLSYLVHMHSRLRSLGQGQVHVGPITWEILPHSLYGLILPASGLGPRPAHSFGFEVLVAHPYDSSSSICHPLIHATGPAGFSLGS
jgi:hypothetical protein